MTVKTTRKIVHIDEEKCNGCGACVPTCAEGALKIINGKAKLVSERYCDGLGACLGECPQGAIRIEERVAEDFDEEAVKHHLEEKHHSEEKLACGCPSTSVQELSRQDRSPCACAGEGISNISLLGNWPVQLALVPAGAPFLRGAAIVLAADCVPFAYPGFHQKFLKDHVLLVACPKLDNFQAHLGKLADILRSARPRSITVVHMEVPCCSGLVHMAKQAVKLSGHDIPLDEITVGIHGELK